MNKATQELSEQLSMVAYSNHDEYSDMEAVAIYVQRLLLEAMLEVHEYYASRTDAYNFANQKIQEIQKRLKTLEPKNE